MSMVKACSVLVFVAAFFGGLQASAAAGGDLTGGDLIVSTILSFAATVLAGITLARFNSRTAKLDELNVTITTQTTVLKHVQALITRIDDRVGVVEVALARIESTTSELDRVRKLTDDLRDSVADIKANCAGNHKKRG